MEKLLPIGSIIYLQEGSQKLMILNRAPQIEDVEKGLQRFDYSACVYPVGLVADQVFYFNTENIDKVLFEGFSDEDETRFYELYEKWMETDGKNIPKGIVGKALEN